MPEPLTVQLARPLKGEQILQILKAAAGSYGAKYTEYVTGRTIILGRGQTREVLAGIKSGSRVISVYSERYTGQSDQDLSINSGRLYSSIVLEFNEWGSFLPHGKLRASDTQVFAKSLMDESLRPATPTSSEW
ncbi:MAG: hypothetical protein JRN21_09330 [Nitrososphaerota archaeon]|nr:hypothetical protein [Nitrososphaerota archaeon]